MAYKLRCFPVHDGVEEEFDVFFGKREDAIIHKMVVFARDPEGEPAMLYVVYD